MIDLVVVFFEVFGERLADSSDALLELGRVWPGSRWVKNSLVRDTLDVGWDREVEDFSGDVVGFFNAAVMDGVDDGSGVLKTDSLSG